MNNKALTLDEIVQNINFPAVLDDFIGGIFIISTDGLILWWSKGAEIITGYTKEEALGRHCSFLESNTCSDFECREGAMNCGLFKRGRVSNIRCTCKDKNGRNRHLLRNGTVITDKAGKVMGGLECIVDITDLISAEKELTVLRNAVRGRTGFGRLTGKSRGMQDIYELIEEVADSSATVMVTGESGTGKELIAEAVHVNSPRRDKPFVKVNCSALPETLLESELFGHMRGAFTGATSDKEGRFEFADGGTLLIDEIGELSPLMQVKLLRVLQDKTFERLGSNRTLKVDVRIIAATNRDLGALVASGKFREDLFYRLNVIPLKVPPLRERVEDIPLLVNAFMERFNRETGKNIKRIDEDAMSFFMDYTWPGNVRELENAIEHAFVRTKGEVITIYSLPQNLRQFNFSAEGKKAVKTPAVPQSEEGKIPFVGKRELTRQIIEQGLVETRYNKQALAVRLGVSRTTLWKRMKELGLYSS